VKTFQCLVGLRHPPRRVAAAIRDLMAELAPSLENVERITTLTRLERPDGGTAMINEWRVNPSLPAALNGMVDRKRLGWLDHAEWSSDLTACAWRIEPYFMGDAIDCRGTTRFEPAMGGRGTKAIFEGRLDIDAAALTTLPAAWRAPATSAVELLISTIIPKNFRKTADAVGILLQGAVQPTSAP
jgi:hypothetical protein